MIPARQPVLSLNSRRANLESLRQESFDVLILGGGINGAGVARDLALRLRTSGRRMRVGVVEQRQFGSGTSSKNSQLIHGGLRYLKQMEFGLVREALRERATLAKIAPHLVEPLPFLIPFRGGLEKAYYGIGLWLYDQLAGRQNIHRRSYLTRDEVDAVEPTFGLDGVTSAAIYYDCRVHSARLVLENIFDAAALGVKVANYTRADQVARERAGFRVALTDTLSGETFETRAAKLVDTTGPWQRGAKLRLVRGSHIVLPKLNRSENAIAYFATDGRIIFVIPWGARKQLSLVGTTDVDHHDGADRVRISADEIRYLLNIVHQLYPAARNLRPLTAYSSLRPLLESASESATKTSREHRIWWEPGRGILHVAGGKYTTYRSMSEEATNLLAEETAPELAGTCSTANTPVGGNASEALDELRKGCAGLAAQHDLATADVELLIRDYGVLAPALLERAPAVAPEGLTRVEAAMLAFAVHHEMARRLADYLCVSTYLGYEKRWSAEELKPLAREMGHLLNWDDERKEQEIQLAREIAAVPEY